MTLRQSFRSLSGVMQHLTATEGLAMPNLTEVRYCPECGSPLISVPVLVCAHCGEEVALRCFTYGPRNGRYFAECIDLDLISQGQSVEEAIGKLQEAMFGYLETVYNGKPTGGLVPRLSPFSHRLRYHLRAASHRIHSLLAGRRAKHLLPRNDQTVRIRFSHC